MNQTPHQTLLGMYGKKSELQTAASTQSTHHQITLRATDRAEITRIIRTMFADAAVRMVHVNTLDRMVLRDILNVKESKIHLHLGPELTDVDYTHVLSALQRFKCSLKNSAVTNSIQQQYNGNTTTMQCSSNGENCLSRMNAYIPVPVLSESGHDTLLIIVSKSNTKGNMEILDL